MLSKLVGVMHPRYNSLCRQVEVLQLNIVQANAHKALSASQLTTVLQHA